MPEPGTSAQAFDLKIDYEGHFILKAYKGNICLGHRLLLRSCFIHCQLSTQHRKCTHYSRRVFLEKRKKKKTLETATSKALQTGCRNAAAFVQLPRRYHKGVWVQVNLFHESGCNFLRPPSNAALASFLWPGKAK